MPPGAVVANAENNPTRVALHTTPSSNRFTVSRAGAAWQTNDGASVANPFEPKQIYVVKALMDDFGDIGAEIFTGESAFTRASEHFDTLKQHPDAYEIQMTRQDGAEHVWVERVRRLENGNWQKISNTAPLWEPKPDSTD